MPKRLGVCLLLLLMGAFPGYGQKKSQKAPISWFLSAEILTKSQLDQAQFTDSLSGSLEAKSYYYVRVATLDSMRWETPHLLCDSFWEVELVLGDSLVSVRDAGSVLNILPLVFQVPTEVNDTPYFYLRCFNYPERSFPWFGFYWVNDDYVASEFGSLSHLSILEYVLPNALCTGLIVSFIVFFGALYLANPRQKVYLHYTLYLIPLAIYLFHRSTYVTYSLLPELTVSIPFWFVFVDFPIQVVFHVAYIIFTFTFLDAKNHYPLYYRVGQVVAFIGSVYFVLFTVGMYIEPYAAWWVRSFQLERLVISLFSFWANIYVIRHSKEKIGFIVATGSLIFLAGAWGAFFGHMNWMRLGSSVEVIFFSLGIGYKIRLERREREQIKSKLIDQLRETEQLQKQYSTQLEKEVKSRSAELVEKTRQVEEEKKQKMKAKLEGKVEEMKMVAMRSQMNPHFLFNSLNSIRHLIIKGQTTEAYDYLSDFAVLMRAVLENAEQEAISLTEELMVIEKYITLEKLRFREDFHFRLSVQSGVDPNQVLIPPLLIQPFLENAIVHGLTPKASDRTLILAVKRREEYLLVEIDDNGVGRNQVNNLQPGKNPMATRIARERLDLFINHRIDRPDQKSYIDIVDKKDNQGKSMGTTVQLVLPLTFANETESNYRR
ncbi:MAG: histidine kinase [Bacteroidota bacterium]